MEDLGRWYSDRYSLIKWNAHTSDWIRLKGYPKPKSFQFWNQCQREMHPAWNTLNIYADYRLVVVTHYPWITMILTILILIYLIQLYLLVLLRILCRTGSSWGKYESASDHSFQHTYVGASVISNGCKISKMKDPRASCFDWLSWRTGADGMPMKEGCSNAVALIPSSCIIFAKINHYIL